MKWATQLLVITFTTVVSIVVQHGTVVALATPADPCPVERIKDEGDLPWDSMRYDIRDTLRLSLLHLFHAAYPEVTLTREKLLLTTHPPFYPRFRQPTVGGWNRVQQRFQNEATALGFTTSVAKPLSFDGVEGWTQRATPPAAVPTDAQACESRGIALVMVNGKIFRRSHDFGDIFDGDMYGYFEFPLPSHA